METSVTPFPQKPYWIAGPCAGESLELLEECHSFLVPLAEKLGLQLIFKASFDKANRSSTHSKRGAGLETLLEWFQVMKSKHPSVILTTDIHLPEQAGPVAEVCDILQIPAFLCRQTDLIVAAAETGKIVSVKKGQFLDPAATGSIVEKISDVSTKVKTVLIERGSCFGYGDLITDMRGFLTMSRFGVPVIYDVTHAIQKPAGGVTAGTREFAAMQARAAVSTGYVSGLFTEVHPDPSKAWSDSATQLNFEQATSLMESVAPLWGIAASAREFDRHIISQEPHR